jgi:hypothetical protein
MVGGMVEWKVEMKAVWTVEKKAEWKDMTKAVLLVG